MKLENPRSIRLRLGMNQTDFWERVGITQPGGSRYETGRKMPRPVQELMRVVYVEKIDLSKLTRTDVEIVAYLKKTQPALYRRLKAAAKA